MNLFNSIQIHQKMIGDKERTLSYKNCIERNVRPKDVILDLGCGTGILSFFAARKNPKKIYAVDISRRIIECAKKTAVLNGMDKRIEFIEADVKKVKLQGKIDVLIHEQIGNFLWNEDIISKVKYIRDNYFKAKTLIIPFKIELYFAPVDYKPKIEESIFFFKKKRHGIDFSNLTKALFMENIEKMLLPSIIRLKNNENFLCREKLVYALDLRKDKRIPKKIEAFFEINRNSRLSGICAFMKIYLDGKSHFSTKPKKINNHWGQMFLPCARPQSVKRNSILKFTLFPKKNPVKWRYMFNGESDSGRPESGAKRGGYA